jgi:hypothetical protein
VAEKIISYGVEYIKEVPGGPDGRELIAKVNVQIRRDELDKDGDNLGVHVRLSADAAAKSFADLQEIAATCALQLLSDVGRFLPEKV